MYVNTIFWGDTPIYLRKLIYLSKHCELSKERNIKIYIIKKIKINSYKTVSQFSIKPLKKCSRHNSMTEIYCALFKYENVKNILR